MLSPPSSLFLIALLSFLFIYASSPSPSVFPCNLPPQEPLGVGVGVCARHWRYCNSPRATLYSLNLHYPNSPTSGGQSNPSPGPLPHFTPFLLFSNWQEWIKECIDVTPVLMEKLRAIWMCQQTQWPCFGHVSLVNERDYSEQLLCRLPADLTVLQLVDIVPSAAQTIEESFGCVFTPHFAFW